MRSASSYRFSRFELDPVGGILLRDAQPAPLSRRAFTLLELLVRNHGRLVTKDQIMDQVWGGLFVDENNLAVQISALRKVLGDGPHGQPFIVNVPGQGYRFVGPVTGGADPKPAASSPMQHRPIVAAAAHPDRRVGRDAPLEILDQALQQALGGTRRFVFVTGEAGIGKTTLVEMARERMSRHNAGFLWGRCSELFGTNEAFLPLIEALEERCRGADGQPMLAALRNHAPTWLAQMPAFLDEADRAAFQDEIFGASRDRMLREFCDLMEVMSADRPWVIVVEDLHWSDFATLDLLSRFARRDRRAAVLVIATYRPADADAHPVRAVHQDLQIHGQATELAVDRLSLADTAQYLALRFGDPKLSEAFAAPIFKRTLGQPLFIVSVIDHWVQQRTIFEEGGAWRLPTTDWVAAEDIPRELRVMITRQIDRLSQGEQQMLEIASASGAEFAAAAIAGAQHGEIEATEQALETLARKGQIVTAIGAAEWPDGTVSGRYAFQHALYQEVLYQRLTPGRRVQAHKLLGIELERGYGIRVGEIAAQLAHHFTEGREFIKAVLYLTLAAQNSARRFSNPEAMNYLTNALDLLDRSSGKDHSLLRAGLLQRRGWIRRAVDDLSGSFQDLNDMVASAAAGGHLQMEVLGLLDLSRFHLFADRRHCLEATERVLVRSQALDDAFFRTLVQGSSAIIKIQLKRWSDEDAELCRNAVEIAGQSRDPRILLRRAGMAGILEYLRSDYRACESATAKGRALAQETGDVYLFGLYHTIESIALLHLGRWGDLERKASAALAMAEKNANTRAIIWCRLTIAFLHVEALDFAGAKARCADTSDPAFEADAFVFFFRRVILARACLGLGDIAGAFAICAEIVQKDEIEGIGLDANIRPHLYLALGGCHLATGNLAEARRRALQLYDFTAAAPDRNYLALAHRLLARIAVADGDPAEARQQVSRALALVESGDLPLAAWKVYQTASLVHGSLGAGDECEDYRRRSDQVIFSLAASLDHGDPLRESLQAGAGFAFD
jgi:DNA-binding winged helix-turn-helix (wHTH) protein